MHICQKHIFGLKLHNVSDLGTNLSDSLFSLGHDDNGNVNILWFSGHLLVVMKLRMSLPQVHIGGSG